MSESIEHNELVRKLYRKTLELVGKDEQPFIKADLFECEKPSLTFSNYIPDLYYIGKELLIVGEAKTVNDFNNEHCKKQLEAYFKECKIFMGKSYLLISLPWELMVTAYNRLLRMKSGLKADKIVIIILASNGVEKFL